MFELKIIAIPTSETRAFQQGLPDAHGLKPEKHVSSGPGNPCRHCLTTIEEGEEMLVLAYRPFSTPQPYAEIGPIFLHGKQCASYGDTTRFPTMFDRWQTVLVRGYGSDDRILYQVARHVQVTELEAQCKEMLSDQSVAYLHIRTSQYNCYQCRVERASVT